MRFLFEWTSGHYCPPRWMAFSHYSVRRDEYLYVAFPLNLLVALVWWIQHRWATHANAPSWIEREVRRREHDGRPF